MTTETANIRDRVARIKITPAIPAVLIPLLQLFNVPAEHADMDEVVRLVSYDNAIAAQCLRVASSPLFSRTKPPNSISAAVLSLGLNRVKSIVVTCCMGQAFPVKKWALPPVVFWRHSLCCAMVCRKFCEKLTGADGETAYVAGLLHDIGFLVNCIAFPDQFEAAVKRACEEQTPLDEAEKAVMGFTHCHTGEMLAKQWGLGAEIVDIIAHHHDVEYTGPAQGLVAIVHLSDLLCRMRGLGYGYYERHKVDMMQDPAWAILAKEHQDLDGVDLARFTFELDEAIGDIRNLVALVFGSGQSEV
ncbi:MAG TPA: HDOD domain-containing protein [Candidatus Acidoferrales bacterium]|jgi:putative nucleotidyltransferase with HDIG domain|nr:HDOD domain-containing protein [Candidatus Acidoferrales bacterium]